MKKTKHRYLFTLVVSGRMDVLVWDSSMWCIYYPLILAINPNKFWVRISSQIEWLLQRTGTLPSGRTARETGWCFQQEPETLVLFYGATAWPKACRYVKAVALWKQPTASLLQREERLLWHSAFLSLKSAALPQREWSVSAKIHFMNWTSTSRIALGSGFGFNLPRGCHVLLVAQGKELTAALFC